LQIADPDRQALNDPELTAPESSMAYQTTVRFKDGQAVTGGVAADKTRYAGEAWANKKGFEFIEPKGKAAKLQDRVK